MASTVTTTESTKIPRRPSFRSSEVCQIAGIKPYVLRSWEQEIANLGKGKGDGPRVYRRADVERVLRLKQLTYKEGLTLAGARRRLEEEQGLLNEADERHSFPTLGPAGRVHCTMEDWAKFVADHLAGFQGKKALLQASSYQTLITPPFPGSYALGWGVHKRSWAGGNAINHNGSNTMNYSCAWMSPKRDFAVLVCTNQGHDLAARACDDVAGNLIQLHLKRTASQKDQ